MIFDRHANLKYKFGNRKFWAEGYYVSTVNPFHAVSWATQVDRARGVQREGRGGEQQDQGGHQAGLRLPQHRQPDRPHHAQVLGPEAGPAGAGGVAFTHTNSRSLSF